DGTVMGIRGVAVIRLGWPGAPPGHHRTDNRRTPTMSRRAANALAPLTAARLLALSAPEAVGAEAPFPDANLEAAVREVLKRAPDDALDDDALRVLYTLEAPAREIGDLTGLERCPNLALIDLKQNAITDLGPLKGL